MRARARKREKGREARPEEGDENRVNASLIIRSPRLEANGPGKRDGEADADRARHTATGNIQLIIRQTLLMNEELPIPSRALVLSVKPATPDRPPILNERLALNPRNFLYARVLLASSLYALRVSFINGEDSFSIVVSNHSCAIVHEAPS